MTTRAVDVAIIGAGTAGLSARREAATASPRVILIESGPYGTTCARVGCMPSKLFIAAAEMAHALAAAGEFGITIPSGARIDGRAVMQRVQRERDRFVNGVLDSIGEIPDNQLVRGHARFVGPNTLEIDDGTRIEARAIVIATGSYPSIPRSLEPVREQVLVSDDRFEWQGLPPSIGLIGTGSVGLELGQALHRLGVRTRLFSQGDNIGPLRDPVVNEAARNIIARELPLLLNAETEFEKDGNGVRVRWRTNGGEGEERFRWILSATGRPPNLAGLDLEKTGLELDERGSPRFDPRTMQCGDSPIFIAGDVNGYRPLLHEAADEGRIAGINAASWPTVQAMRRRTPLGIVFTDPQLAVVGTGFPDLDDGVAIGSIDYRDQGRARVIGKNAGLIRIYARRETGTLIGAEMVAPRVEHMAHLLAWAVQRELTAADVLDLPFYHPVLEEGIRSAIRALCSELKTMPPERSQDLECGPGS
ncbi:MAG: dihydrolipoyl dehydrogenase [Gammaproteobacteria bacterium]